MKAFSLCSTLVTTWVPMRILYRPAQKLQLFFTSNPTLLIKNIRPSLRPDRLTYRSTTIKLRSTLQKTNRRTFANNKKTCNRFTKHTKNPIRRKNRIHRIQRLHELQGNRKILHTLRRSRGTIKNSHTRTRHKRPSLRQNPKNIPHHSRPRHFRKNPIPPHLRSRRLPLPRPKPMAIKNTVQF